VTTLKEARSSGLKFLKFDAFAAEGLPQVLEAPGVAA